ncbi:MAG: hypothetical protein JWP44_1327 [Mucilaginibacter sp.]|nr:hypothetical protein [Mucilaginibacter sp.]
MTNNINHYSGSHYVLLTLEKDTKIENACSPSIDLTSHLQLSGAAKIRKSNMLWRGYEPAGGMHYPFRLFSG